MKAEEQRHKHLNVEHQPNECVLIIDIHPEPCLDRTSSVRNRDETAKRPLKTGACTSTTPTNGVYKQSWSEKFFPTADKNRKRPQKRREKTHRSICCGPTMRRRDRTRSAPAGCGTGRARSDVGISFRYAPKRFALRTTLGLRSSRCPHRNEKKDKYQRIRINFSQ